ncbi:MAG: A/G-specific adenine glycosylase [Halieaceae bacterium]|jgi:A/G-specific adenine glycosylase|nr:A/G-specific adenine glycosylase [Halieaceae bacterium]
MPARPTAPHPFATRVLAWFDRHGRKDLPWQRDTSPYRVWVSEIMLQQTQVKTVIPYFERFMQALPSVQALAAAGEDDVLHLWTGLGYYARGRNLHRAAKYICSELGGEFPRTVEGLCELPGIGRSTAGAIVSIAYGQRAVILDGNVKRVLARYRAIGGWPGQGAVHEQLWQLAGQYTPAGRSADYSQAVMDLGATLCTRSTPDCERCPLADDCEALALGQQLSFPGKKPRRTLPVKSTAFIMASASNGDIWLERRPGSGIWGGLWCFPELAHPGLAADWCRDRLGVAPASIELWPGFRHTFSHYHLDIQPVRVTLPSDPTAVMEAPDQLWYNRRRPAAVGLAAPVASLLAQLA